MASRSTEVGGSERQVERGREDRKEREKCGPKAVFGGKGKAIDGQRKEESTLGLTQSTGEGREGDPSQAGNTSSELFTSLTTNKINCSPPAGSLRGDEESETARDCERRVRDMFPRTRRGKSHRQKCGQAETGRGKGLAREKASIEVRSPCPDVFRSF